MKESTVELQLSLISLKTTNKPSRNEFLQSISGLVRSQSNYHHSRLFYGNQWYEQDDLYSEFLIVANEAIDKYRWLCKKCHLVSKSQSALENHVRNKHPELLKEGGKISPRMQFNTYLIDQMKYKADILYSKKKREIHGYQQASTSIVANLGSFVSDISEIDMSKPPQVSLFEETKDIENSIYIKELIARCGAEILDRVDEIKSRLQSRLVDRIAQEVLDDNFCKRVFIETLMNKTKKEISLDFSKTLSTSLKKHRSFDLELERLVGETQATINEYCATERLLHLAEEI